MGAISLSDSRSWLRGVKANDDNGLVEEIEGLISVYMDGKVERHPIMPIVACGYVSESDVASWDATIDANSGVWARFYLPKRQRKLPLLIYFHGGGFCVGSPAWKCYHDFLSKLASTADCIIMSVNYRLAPEHRLPAAFEDGSTAIKWAREQASKRQEEQSWWWAWCNFSKVFIGGDSAGACLAYNVVIGTSPSVLTPLRLKGMVLVQPFFGGEARTKSERSMNQPPNSVLTLKASDCYWRMALPVGTNRDHPWCNPLWKGWSNRLEDLSLPPSLVCVAEKDILKERNLDLCAAMRRAGKSVEHFVYKGMGHAFQILNTSPSSRAQTYDMISHIRSFMNR